MLKKLHTSNAPEAIGPYSQAIIYNDILYTSGQIAINPQTGNVESDTIEGQTEQVMKNLSISSASPCVPALPPKSFQRMFWSK